MTLYQSKIDRRTALKWISAATAAMAVVSKPARSRTYVKAKGGYGTDPNLVAPTSPWDRIMTDHQLHLTAALSDIILPADDPHPSATMVGVPDFINEWVSSPYPQTGKDKGIILDGLTWLDDQSSQQFGAGFLELTQNQQEALVAEMAKPSTHKAHLFFDRFRYLTLGGYYTTPEGFEDIGYIGNVPLDHYPGPGPVLTAKLEKRLQALGL